MKNMIAIDNKYKEWLGEVGSKFKNSQIKAAIKVNEEMLHFYYWLGRKISELKNEINIGNIFYNEVSNDLQKILPDVKSFSPTNLKYMQYFYELYESPQLGDSEKRDLVSQQHVDFDINIFKIPWGHHRCIIDKCIAFN